MASTPVLRPRDLPGDPIPVDGLGHAYRQALPTDPVDQARAVWWALRHDPHLERSTADRIGGIIARFAARQRSLGRTRLSDLTPDDAAGFVWARTRRGHDPALATVHLRRTALRLLLRALGQLGDPLPADPTAALVLPPRSRRVVRPLDRDEIALVRIAAAGKAQGRQQAMATLALAETGATTGEIAQLRHRHLRLSEGTVALPGAGLIRARTATLTDWGAAVLQRGATSEISGDNLIVYRGTHPPDSQPAQAAVVNRLRRLLTIAGLIAADVRPTSIRLWPAAELLAAGASIEQAADLLGLSSLDVAADQLGYRWQR